MGSVNSSLHTVCSLLHDHPHTHHPPSHLHHTRALQVQCPGPVSAFSLKPLSHSWTLLVDLFRSHFLSRQLLTGIQDGLVLAALTGSQSHTQSKALSTMQCSPQRTFPPQATTTGLVQALACWQFQALVWHLGDYKVLGNCSWLKPLT